MDAITDDKEGLRLAALAMLGLLDTAAEREFDVLIGVAQRMFACKIALFSLIDSDRQWFKAQCGVGIVQTPRDQSFCAIAVEKEEPLIVPDATKDLRFSANPLVLGEPHIRFYAGVPVRAKIAFGQDASVAIGTICIIDDKPRQMHADELGMLRNLAILAEALIDARLSALHARAVAKETAALVEKLNSEQRLFEQAERMANVGSWSLRLADEVAEWSDHVFAIHDLPVGQMPPLSTALDFYPPHARDVVTGAIARTIETGEPFSIETDFITAKGRCRRVRSIGELQRADGVPFALIGVFQDVTEKYTMEQTLRKIAGTDDLTQIPNRSHCNQRLEELIATAHRNGQKLALLLIDLDGFKQVNDRCGHHIGDQLLISVGQRLQAGYLGRCFAARLGGDEFVLIVSDQDDCNNLDAIVQRLLTDLRHTINHEGSVVSVSGSIGISCLDETVTTRSQMMLRADKALYAAKKTQRGSAEIYTANEQIRSVA